MSDKITELKISEIDEKEGSLRTTVNKQGLKYTQLRDSLKSGIPLLNPISVRVYTKPDGTQGYQLVDGLHRKTAYAELGWETIPVNLITIDDAKVLIAQFVGNNSVPTTKAQLAQGIKQLVQFNGWTIKEVSAQLHRGEKEVAQYLNIADLPEPVLKLIDDGKIVLPNAIALTQLPDELMEEFLPRAISEKPDLFVTAVTERVNELKAQAQTGRKAVKEFEEKARVRTTTALKSALDEVKNTGTVVALAALVQNLTNPADVVAMTLKWVLSLDPVSVAAEKAKFDAERVKAAESEKARKEKAKAAAEKAIQDAQAKLEKLKAETTVAA